VRPALDLPAPIFLLAPPRSFTTLVSGMLGMHPETYGLPELTLFFRPNLKDMWLLGRADNQFDPRMRHGILRAVAEVYFGEQSDEAIAGAERWCAARQHRPVAEVFNELRAKLAPFRIVEKSPDYTLSVAIMKRLFEACPDARFIFLTRHPIKQCESTLNINSGSYPRTSNSIAYENGKAILDPQIAWHDANLNVMLFLQEHVPPGQYLRVQGEELLAEPEQSLAAICRWLGLRDDPEAIAMMLQPERNPFACFGPVSALFGNDPNFLRNPYFGRQSKKKLPSLDAPLAWRSDGGRLYPEVVAMAREFGY